MAKVKNKCDSDGRTKKISYQEYTYEWSEDHLDAGSVAQQIAHPEAIYKTLVAVGNKTGPIVAVIPGDQELDLKKIAKASGNKSRNVALKRPRRDHRVYSRWMFTDRHEEALSNLY